MDFEQWIAQRAVPQIATGNNPNLIRWLYLPVDSTIDKDVVGTFDITDLQVAGLDGWDIVAVIPKTYGMTLTNLSTQGNTWGGGLGGNVVGVYVILSKELSDVSDQRTRGEAERIVDRLLAKGAEL